MFKHLIPSLAFFGKVMVVLLIDRLVGISGLIDSAIGRVLPKRA